MKKLLNENRNLKNRIKRLEKREKELLEKNGQINKKQFQDACYKFLTPNAAKFMVVQAQNADKKLRGAKYPNSFKRFCLSLYFLSPKAYRFLRKVFCLPATCTLNKLTRNWQYSPGLHDSLFETFKIKVDRFSEMEKETLLCIDEMSIKKFVFYNIACDEIIGLEKKGKNKISCSNHAMVLMARGLTSNWKQPIAYWLCENSYNDEDLSDIIIQCIQKFKNIGLKVRGLISDMGKNFVSSSEKNSNVLSSKLGRNIIYY